MGTFQPFSDVLLLFKLPYLETLFVADSYLGLVGLFCHSRELPVVLADHLLLLFQNLTN